MPPKSPNCYAAENNPKGPYISTVLVGDGGNGGNAGNVPTHGIPGLGGAAVLGLNGNDGLP